jgi:hypothetical protein
VKAGNHKRNTKGLKPFKKGESGNPSGRPKTLPLTEAYREIAQMRVPKNVDPKQRTYSQLIALAIASEAMHGKVQAAIEIADRIEGKAINRVDFTGDVAVTVAPATLEEARERIREFTERVRNRRAAP